MASYPCANRRSTWQRPSDPTAWAFGDWNGEVSGVAGELSSFLWVVFRLGQFCTLRRWKEHEGSGSKVQLWQCPAVSHSGQLKSLSFTVLQTECWDDALRSKQPRLTRRVWRRDDLSQTTQLGQDWSKCSSKRYYSRRNERNFTTELSADNCFH